MRRRPVKFERRRREASPSDERFICETVMLSRLVRKAKEREKGVRAQDIKPTTLDTEPRNRSCLPNGVWDLNDGRVIMVCDRPTYPLLQMVCRKVVQQKR